MKKPNVVLILTDDQRFDALGAAGNPYVKTPNLDALAARGSLFSHACIPGGTSGAVCMPSRAMLHTGRTLFHLQGQGEDIPKEHTLLGEHLRAHGYHAFATGKWHNGPPAVNRAFDGGENIFFGGMWDHWNVPTSRYDPTGEYDNVINFTANFFSDNHTTQVHCDTFHPGVHSSELLSDTAIGFIDGQSGEEPFFLYAAYLAPHDPRTMPEAFKAMFPPQDAPLPPNAWENHPFAFGVEDIRDELLAASPRDKEEIKRHIAEYAAMVAHLDHEIGRVLDELEHKGLLEDTIVVVAGDNGLAVGQHGLMGKQNLYEHSIRVPLIMAGPGVPSGKKIEDPVYLLDIFPTLCDLLGLPTPDSVEGKSFAPTLGEGAVPPHREAMYYAYTDSIRAVRIADKKLIAYRGVAHKEQLFDLASDPWEMHNCIDDAAYAQDARQLRGALLRMKDEWEDNGHPMSQTYWGR